MITVPTFGNFADYTEIVQLAGVTYRLRFYFNTRSDSWYLDVLGAGGTVFVAGVRVRLEWPLLRQYVLEDELPAGQMVVLDLLNTRREPSRDDINDTIAPLTFTPDAEVDVIVEEQLGL